MSTKMKMFTLLTLCIFMVLSLSASTASQSTSAVADIVLKLGTNHALNSPTDRGTKKFAEICAQKSNGHLKVQVYGQRQLGGEEELMQGIRLGTLDMAIVAAGTIAKFVPNFKLFTLPYLFKDYAHFDRVVDSDVGTQLIKEAADQGKVKILSPFWADGFRNYFNDKRPIRKPSDMKGLKIRVPDWPALIQATSLFGANPVAMPFGEAYVAVSSGMLDGLETVPIAAVNENFADIVKYMCLDHHVFAPTDLLINIKKYNSLSDEYKKIIDDASKEAGEYQIKETRIADENAINTLKEAGMIITEVDEQAFMKAALPVYENFKGEIDQNLVKMIQELRNE